MMLVVYGKYMPKYMLYHGPLYYSYGLDTKKWAIPRGPYDESCFNCKRCKISIKVFHRAITISQQQRLHTLINRHYSVFLNPTGLIDTPNIPVSFKAQEVSYKIFLLGKAGAGKTSIVSKLVGRGMIM